MPDTVETGKLWSELHEALLSYIGRRVATPHDAEDVLQDVFLRIHAHLHAVKNTESITAWIYRIARNAITDYHRKRAAAARALRSVAENGDVPAEAAHSGLAEADVTREAGEEFSRCVEPLLNQVPEPYRQAVALTDLEGITQKDAARRLGLSVSGMKARVQRGRGKLKEALLDCCSVELDRRGGLVDYERRRDAGCTDCECD